MDGSETRPRAEAALAWAVEAAGRDPGRGYAAGLGDGLLVGLALAKLDADWASIALDELLQIQQERLAAQLTGTPVPAPEIEMHRLLIFAQAQAVLRGRVGEPVAERE
jgi:hypothetical protein